MRYTGVSGQYSHSTRRSNFHCGSVSSSPMQDLLPSHPVQAHLEKHYGKQFICRTLGTKDKVEAALVEKQAKQQLTEFASSSQGNNTHLRTSRRAGRALMQQYVMENFIASVVNPAGASMPIETSWCTTSRSPRKQIAICKCMNTPMRQDLLSPRPKDIAVHARLEITDADH